MILKGHSFNFRLNQNYIESLIFIVYLYQKYLVSKLGIFVFNLKII